MGIDHTRGTNSTLTRHIINVGNNQSLSFNGGTTPQIEQNITLTSISSVEVLESSMHPINSDAGPFTIGHQSKNNLVNNNEGRRFDGSIAELLGYNRVLSATEIRQVETYLAIKYGITLDPTGGGTAGDYRNTNDVLVWDASINNDYHNDVIGIGRDDQTDLLQKQSHQDDDSTRIYLSSLTETNSINPGSFSGDSQFVLMGHNNTISALR